MSITIAERHDSRTNETGPTGYHERIYDVSGTDDHDAATSEVESETPATIDGRPRQRVRLEPIGHELWLAMVRWQLTPSGGIAVPTTGEVRISGRTSGGRKHVTQSREHLDTKGNPASAALPDHKGAVNVTEDSVDGVEIIEPVDEFVISKWIADASFAAARTAAFGITAHTNNGTWRGYAAGEVLFMGITYTYRDSHDDWQVDYEFAARPNQADVEPFEDSDEFTLVRGWEYIWVEYRDVVDSPFTAEVTKAKQPVAAHLERMYDPANFGALDLD